MREKNNVDGKIIKINKLWWLKINKKCFRTTLLDGATFPYKVKFVYNVNNTIIGLKLKNEIFLKDIISYSVFRHKNIL